MIKKLATTSIIMFQILIGRASYYDNDKLIGMLKDYFKTNQNAPQIIGHSFYGNDKKMVFQMEIQTQTKNVNKDLIFSFNTISKITQLAKTNFTHSVLVIHFTKDFLPIIAESSLKCNKKIFIDKVYDENQWRKHCLTIKNYN